MKQYSNRTLLLAGVSATALLLSSGVVVAQQTDGAVEEVLVTATKRNESIQDTPLAVTAFTADFANRVNIDDVKDLIKFTPGMSGNSQDSFLDFVNVRGISTNDFGVGGDASIGLFKNGLYQGRTGAVVSSLFDISSAEVLRGPQGFLFGRDAISGAISFQTMKPNFDASSGYAKLGIGERGIKEGEVGFNLPVSETFALRFAGYRSKENGYITNIARPNADPMYGHNKVAGRVTAAMKGDSWDAYIMAEYEDKQSSGTAYTVVDVLSDAASVADGYASETGVSAFDWMSEIAGIDVRPGPDLRSINSDQGLGEDDHAKIFQISGEINVDLPFGKLTSLTGYKDHEYFYAEDYDGLPVSLYDYSQDQTGDYFEQELRIVSDNDGPLSWYVGGSYFKEHINTSFLNHGNEDALCGAYYGDLAQANYPDDYDGALTTCEEIYTYWGYTGDDIAVSQASGLTEGADVRGIYSGWGAYIDLTYDVTEKLDVGVGVRYTKNTRDFGISVLPVTSDLGHWASFGAGTDGFVSTVKSWDDFTPRFIARYRATENAMLYASVTKGFKSGGFNSLGILYDDIDDDGNAINGRPDPFEPETVWSYEVGVKGSSDDNRLRYDLNAYYYKYTDLQLNFWDGGVKVANVGRVKATGIEGSLQYALNDNFDVMLSAGLNSNEINDAEDITPGSDGNRLSGSPKTKLAGLLSYHTPITSSGDLVMTADFVYQSSVFSSGIANLKASELPSYTDASIRIGYEDAAGWAITAYVENVLDTVYYDGGYEGAFPLPSVLIGVSRPRTFGAKFSMTFGE